MPQRPKGRVPHYPETITPPPVLPDAHSLRSCGLPLKEDEFDLVRAAMATHAVSRQPKLTWRGWKLIGAALLIGERYAKKAAGGASEGGAFNYALAPFLRTTGFAFLNKGVRWAARQCALHAETIDPWRESLPDHMRSHLHNPIDIWDAYTRRNERQDPPRPNIKRGSKTAREQASLVEYCVALEEQVEALREQLEEAEAALAELRAKTV
jgi:hypothetical protein